MFHQSKFNSGKRSSAAVPSGGSSIALNFATLPDHILFSQHMSFAYNRKAPALEDNANKSCLRCKAFTSRRRPHAARTPSATSLSAQGQDSSSPKSKSLGRHLPKPCWTEIVLPFIEHARYVMEMGVTKNADYLSSLLQVSHPLDFFAFSESCLQY